MERQKDIDRKNAEFMVKAEQYKSIYNQHREKQNQLEMIRF